MSGALVATVFGLQSSNTNYSQDTSQNDEKILSLKAALASAANTEGYGSDADSEQVDPEKALASLIAAATVAAEKVAAAQQEYARLAYLASTQPGAGNGVPSSAALAMVAARRPAAQLWDPASLIVKGEAAYTFDTVEGYGADQIDPRFPWYVGYYDPEAKQKTSKRTTGWTTELVMPVTTDTTAKGAAARAGATQQEQVDVLWVCRDGDGELLAWAEAIFSAKNGRFSDLNLVITTAGSSSEAGAGTAAMPTYGVGR